MVDYYVPKSITKRAFQISRSYEQHKNLAILKEPVKNSYILTLLLITLVIIFSATWFGLYLAKGITVPIQRLAEGTHQVAQGNWDYQIEPVGDDEIGTLVDSFNQMTQDLKQINVELERRGRYTEMLLANITAGVISVDPAGKITTMNKAAIQMLGLGAEQALGKNYAEVFQVEHLRVMREMMEQVREGASVEQEVRIPHPDRFLTLMAAAATLRDDEGKILGVMVFLEDITQIQKVQRMEAWRLKNLVNEFSQFARLPAAELAPNDLNETVKEALFLFKEGHKGIHFKFDNGELPPLELDRDQIKRALINLLDNAVAAVEEGGEVRISTAYDPSFGIVHLEVADNGCGLAPEVRARIFEPYFSTKKNGTGLGLAIVSAIVADHRGYIRVRQNEPKGTRLIIELPVRVQAQAQEIRNKAVYS
ncbi:MAG: PAS domain S-box protein [Deltaproteobacteria bacterium]|nr:PAS domain S-box protein [Deltaproteobacteria bacterium]